MKKYLSLVKFSHTVFALPFALIGFFLAVAAGYPFQWKLLLLVLACMVSARNAAMAFNRWLDRDIDAQNPRTARREIPAGVIPSGRALMFVILNGLAFITATFFINRLCFFLAPVALAVVLGYSAAKRFTSLSHFILGLGLSLAPMGAYLAVSARFGLVPVILSFVVLCWVSGFDIIYALQDTEFDRLHHLFSIPAWLGNRNALVLSSAVHGLVIGLLVWLGVTEHSGLMYWIGALVFTSLLVYQHTLVKPGDLSKVNLAFFTLNGLASLLFAAFFLLDLWKQAAA